DQHQRDEGDPADPHQNREDVQRAGNDEVVQDRAFPGRNRQRHSCSTTARRVQPTSRAGAWNSPSTTPLTGHGDADRSRRIPFVREHRDRPRPPAVQTQGGAQMAYGYLTPRRRGSLVTGGPSGGGLFDLHRQMNRLFDDLFDQHGDSGVYARAGMKTPALEIHQTDDRHEITAELPGVREEDIDLTVEDGVLTLRGEKKS